MQNAPGGPGRRSIGRHLARIDALWMAVGGGLLVLAIGLVFLHSRAIFNLLGGPFAIDRATLAEIRSPDEGPAFYLTVRGDRITETGIDHMERRLHRATQKVEGERVLARYYALWLGSRVVVVKLPPEADSLTVSGVLTEIPSTVQTKFIARVEAERAGMKGLFHPFMIDATSHFRRNGRLALGLLGASALLGLFLLARATRRTRDPLLHRSLRRLARLGPPAEVLRTLEDELAGDGALRRGRVTLTRHHLVAFDRLGLRGWRLDELVWVYPRETRQVLQLVPLRRFHLCLGTRQHEHHSVVLGIDELQDLLEAVAERVPWVLVGYEDELAVLWEVAPARLLARVDTRRSEVAQVTGPDELPGSP
jgi:hypothetical protein